PLPGAVKRVPPRPGPVETYVREAERQRDAGNFEAAVVAYRKAIELRGKPVSDEGDLQYELGKVYSRMERYEAAAAEFQYASTRRPSSETALYATYELGNAYLDLGKYADAVAAYEQTLKLLTGEWSKSRPRLSAQYLPYPHYSRGLAHLGSGQKEQAVADFEKAIELKPDFHEAHFNLGLTIWQLGRREVARATETRLRNMNAALAAKLAALFK
ncbi:MAG TPA: tetratricopeptide repeat protein, partial [Pyrinomonadaceae bacterium]